MAGDLIPPPSPAGRPEPDAMAGVRAEPDPPPVPAETPAPPGESPFRTRFGFVWGVLAGIAVCAAALTVVLAASTSDDGPALAPNWSEWQPSTSRMLAGAQDIAEHVAARYRLDGGDQLATVAASEMELEGEKHGVAIRPKGGALEVLDGPGILYILNGFGKEGRTPGSESRALDRLLMREALELSLYSFRYLDDVTMVAVLLPPAEKSERRESERYRAVLYRPGDLLEELRVPLAETLASQPPEPKTMTKEEAARVESLGLRNRFNFSIQSLGGSLPYLVFAEPDVVD